MPALIDERRMHIIETLKFWGSAPPRIPIGPSNALPTTTKKLKEEESWLNPRQLALNQIPRPWL